VSQMKTTECYTSSQLANTQTKYHDINTI